MNLSRYFAVALLFGGLLSVGFTLSSPPESRGLLSTELVTKVSRHVENEEQPGVMASVDRRFAKETDEIPDFQRHVGPLLGRLGCNGRSCHGSFQGQGGFQLTLFGYDFDADHSSLLADGSYRVDVEDPEGSLVLSKPTDANDHGGGVRFAEESWQYRLIKNWIQGGAKNFDENQRLVSLTVTPSEIITSPEQVDELKVVANWSDGAKEDVTPLVRFQSNDPQIASVDESGKVVGGSTGDTHLIVFYDNEVVNIPVISPVKRDVSNAMPFDNPTDIDMLVMEKLNKLGIEPSKLSDDAVFLRRVSLDVAGTLPSPDEIRSFLDNNDPDKRTRKIEELLESRAYAAWWTTFLCDMTGNSSEQLRNVMGSDMAAKGWYQWIYNRVADNTPYDEIVQGIVISNSRLEGESLTEFSERMSADYQDGQADRFAEMPTMPYYWMRQDFNSGDTLAISFAHSFLGVRLQCAQCHKHPFDQWTMHDFKQFSRFFSGVRRVQPQKAVKADEKDELAKILAALELDPELNGGRLRRALDRAGKRDGTVIPFSQLAVTPARKSRAELQEEQKALEAKKAAQKQQRKQMSSESQGDMDSEMNGGMNDEMGQSMGSESKSDQEKTEQESDAKPQQNKKLTRAERKQLQRERQRKLQEARRQRNRNRYYTDAILLGSEAVQLKDFKDARMPAMNWLKHEQNPYFAKAIVNRIWAQYFGVGIVEPADDMNLANPPSNGPLLEYLADGFVENGYDLKWVHRQITNSNIYQLSWQPNETNQTDRRNFSRALPRRLPAEVVYDALHQATASKTVSSEFREQTESRAIAIPGTVSGRNRRGRADVKFAMEIFGKSDRDSSCDCDRSDQTSLVQTVFMRNDRHVHNELSRPDGWIGKMKGGEVEQLTKQQIENLQKSQEQLAGIRAAIKVAKDRNRKDQVKRLQKQVRRHEKRIAPLQKSLQKMQEAEATEHDIDQLIEEAWLRTLSRLPTSDEMQTCRDYINTHENTMAGLTGIMWSLVNTKEFIVNH